MIGFVLLALMLVFAHKSLLMVALAYALYAAAHLSAGRLRANLFLASTLPAGTLLFYWVAEFWSSPMSRWPSVFRVIGSVVAGTGTTALFFFLGSIISWHVILKRPRFWRLRNAIVDDLPPARRAGWSR